MTNNCALVEIKTPRTKLLNARPARNGVYTPSADLVGAINQALDQKHEFEKQIAQIKDNSNLSDIASYAVPCCLLIGTMPKNVEQQKSLELFRTNSKNVQILTYDEVFEKLKQFREFLILPEQGNDVLSLRRD